MCTTVPLAAIVRDTTGCACRSGTPCTDRRYGRRLLPCRRVRSAPFRGAAGIGRRRVGAFVARDLSRSAY